MRKHRGNKSNRKLGLSRQRLFLWIKLIGTSALFSSLIAFFLDYYLIQKPRLVQVEAETRKIAVETARAELENQIKKIEAVYTEQIQQLNVQNLQTSNKLNLIEADIKENQRKIAVIEAENKLLKEKIAILKEGTQAINAASDLYTSIAPKLDLFSESLEAKSEGGRIILIERLSLKNEGKYAMHVQTNVVIYTQDKTNKISGYEWHNSSNERTFIAPGQQLPCVYEVHLLPSFYSNLTTEKRRFYIRVNYTLLTDRKTVDFVIKQKYLDPYYTKDSINGMSAMSRFIEAPFKCWHENRPYNFSCTIN